MTTSTGRRILADVGGAVCTAPCDRIIDATQGDEFYFSGKGITRSERFSLVDVSGDISAHVHPGSEGMRTAAVVGVVTGTLLTLVGGATLASGLAWNASNDADSHAAASTAAATGGVLLGVGVAALVTGVVLMVSSSTTYELHSTSAKTPN